MTGDGGALPPPPLSVSVDLDHPTPPYEQIRAQIAAHLSAGALRPGDRLPTVRALAADLGVAVGTVSRAYRELEQEGAVTSRRRTGTVVSRDAPGTADRPAPPRPEAARPEPDRSEPRRSEPHRSEPRRSEPPGAELQPPEPRRPGPERPAAGLVAAADALATAAVRAGLDDRDVLTLVSGALLIARRPDPRGGAGPATSLSGDRSTGPPGPS